MTKVAFKVYNYKVRAIQILVYQDDSVPHGLLKLSGRRQLLAQTPLHPLLGFLQMAKVLIGDLVKNGRNDRHVPSINPMYEASCLLTNYFNRSF